MLYNITYRNNHGETINCVGISEGEWRFIRAACHENGWEILQSEAVRKK